MITFGRTFIHHYLQLAMAIFYLDGIDTVILRAILIYILIKCEKHLKFVKPFR